MTVPLGMAVTGIICWVLGYCLGQGNDAGEEYSFYNPEQVSE